jgi:ABC-2 type transport system permease protein
MITAMRVELLKLRRSPVGVIASVALLVGILGILSGITAGVAAGQPEVIAQAGRAATLNWTGLTAGAAQIIAAAGFIGFGVVLAWMFGREFSDGTVTGLFTLPISRAKIALAKLLVYMLWVLVMSFVLVLGVLLLGLLLGYGAPAVDNVATLARQTGLGIFTGALAVPVAWVATVTRSLLGAVGTVIGLVVIAQVGALAGAGAWMPLAAPALWAMSDHGEVTALQLFLAALWVAVFVVLTYSAWVRLQLNR